MVRILRLLGRLGQQDPAALGLRPVRRCTAAGRCRATIGGSSRTIVARRHVGRPVQHQAERPVRRVVAEQHDRPREVRILQLRHREQQRSAEPSRDSRCTRSHAASRRPRRRARHQRIAHVGSRAAPATLRRRGVAGVADRHRQVPAQPPDAGPLHRAALQQRAQLVVRPPPQIEQRRRVEAGPRLPRRIGGHAGRRRQVPRDRPPGRCRSRRHARPIASRCSTGIAPLYLDRQIGQAPRRVEHAGLDERAGRARVEAAACTCRTDRAPARRARAAGCR